LLAVVLLKSRAIEATGIKKVTPRGVSSVTATLVSECR